MTALVEAISAIAPVAVWGGLVVALLWLAWVGLANLLPRHMPPSLTSASWDRFVDEMGGLKREREDLAQVRQEMAAIRAAESPWMQAARHAADAGHAAVAHSAPRHLRRLDIPAALVDPPTRDLAADPFTAPIAGEPLPAATYADLRQAAGWHMSTAAWAALINTTPTPTPGATQ